MRVLFTASLLAALVSAGGAPAPKGNSAKRNIDQHLAPHRFDKTKVMINSDSTNNSGGGELTLQVVLKADDDNRAQQELHTTLALKVGGIQEGMEINVGWAMNLADPDLIVGDEEGNPDQQGTEVTALKERARNYKGPNGWDGVNAWAVYNGENDANWSAQEVWQTEEPDVYNNGLAGLTIDANNNFLVFQEFSDILCTLDDDGTSNNCEATVVTERIWDTQMTENGHRIENSMERAFSFIGWY